MDANANKFLVKYLIMYTLQCSRDAGGVAGAERLVGEFHSLGKCSYHGTNSYAL